MLTPQSAPALSTIILQLTSAHLPEDIWAAYAQSPGSEEHLSFPVFHSRKQDNTKSGIYPLKIVTFLFLKAE